MTTLFSFHLYSSNGALVAIPMILMLDHFVNARQSMPKPQRIFLLVFIIMFLPLVPNILLSEALLAWWALSIPVKFWAITTELRHQSQLLSVANRN